MLATPKFSELLEQRPGRTSVMRERATRSGDHLGRAERSGDHARLIQQANTENPFVIQDIGIGYPRNGEHHCLHPSQLNNIGTCVVVEPVAIYDSDRLGMICQSMNLFPGNGNHTSLFLRRAKAMLVRTIPVDLTSDLRIDPGHWVTAGQNIDLILKQDFSSAETAGEPGKILLDSELVDRRNRTPALNKTAVDK
jgi:hypothetical protein